jgi:hypothetical protein
LQTLWLKSRVREVVWGILGGSIAGAIFPSGRSWIATSFTQTVGDISEHVPNFRGPAIAAMLAILALILPRFLRKTVCPFRSWNGGLFRGTSLIWAIVALFYWAERAHLFLCVVAGLAFHSCTDIVQARRNQEQCRATEIGDTTAATGGDRFVPGGSRRTAMEFARSVPLTYKLKCLL